ERVSGDPSSGVAYAALAADGSLAYVPATGLAAERSIVLTDRSGKARTLALPARAYHYPRFSPDGKRLAFTIGPGHGNSDDVWTVDIETGAMARLTIGDGNGNYYPVWSNDGRRIAYSSDQAHQGIFLKRADSVEKEEALLPTPGPDVPADWSRDGTKLAITRNFPATDIVLVSFPDRRETRVGPGGSSPRVFPHGQRIPPS